MLRDIGITAPSEELLAKNGIHLAVYDKTGANPTVNNVGEARQLYIDEKCQCLIALCGGSSIYCAKSVGGQYNIPHGLANSVPMPIVLEEYGKSAHKKLHRPGIAAGVCRPDDSHEEGAEKLIQAIRDLNRRMGIPDTLCGIKNEDIPKMARHAAKEANPLYPVPKLMTAKEPEHFYYKVKDRSLQ